MNKTHTTGAVRSAPVTSRVMRHIVPISGKDSLATALILRATEPAMRCEYVWHDTGWELPEVHAWIATLEQTLGPIVRCGRDLTEIVAEQGLLPSPMRRFCTKYAKIFAMRDWLAGCNHTLYLGLRADEADRTNGLTRLKHQVFRFPLQEKGIGLSGVWKMVEESDLAPPRFTWPWMVDRVRELSGRRPSGIPDWEWHSLFSGRSRSNCDRCFFQRQYEWIWLYETHPDRFQQAVDLEESTQDASPFRLLGKDKPLVSLIARRGEIKERRAKQIARCIEGRRQMNLFPVITMSSLDAYSCGIFCGK